MMKEKLYKNYLIHSKTLAILPSKQLGFDSIVLEADREIPVKRTAIQIIDDTCIDGLSTYQGRRRAVAKILKAFQKLPIILNEKERIITFPTVSPENMECVWICFNNVSSYTPSPSDDDTTSITFYNGKLLNVPVKYHVIHRQMGRGAKLYYYCFRPPFGA
ncbi:competence protein ComK [Salipaludibacillus sp. CUR1]|uniref:competence protein ComK n=1 Tax=Salipaludibacillus sp. CUR1 TaxID=2820003 RepID=UPI001E548EE7|nr:competence protein ComK [Salipaludibacillus sp. CUR1]MCE7792372.1 competence protein ComK [Salipaludibacillus sp. CUR1]